MASIADWLSGTETWNASALPNNDNSWTMPGDFGTVYTPSVNSSSTPWWQSALDTATSLFTTYNDAQVKVANSAALTTIAKTQAKNAATAAAVPNGNAGAGVGVFGQTSGAGVAGVPMSVIVMGLGALALLLVFKK